MKSIFLTIFLFCSFILAQDVITYSGNETDLAKRWDWAEKKAQQLNIENYWVVYTFERLMPENNTIGHYYHSGESSGKKLAELLYPNRPIDYIMSLKGHYKSNSTKKVQKEIALLHKIENNSVTEVDMSTIDLHFRLKGLPVLWLGITNEQQSIHRIIDTYNNVKSEDTKETLISAVGMHKSVDESYNFLKEVINSDENGELREDAVFWIGHIGNPKVIPLLKETALSDHDEDVAEKAVFSLHNMDTDEALDAVIFLTQKAKGDVREKAIFWLGQLAGKKAIESLEDIVFSEDETDIQKQAVFALSQLDDDRGIPKLIKIANEHPNPKIRKNAIFWLGESGDDRALDALIKMVKK